VAAGDIEVVVLDAFDVVDPVEDEVLDERAGDAAACLVVLLSD
jgi:hypothetical protein